MTSRGSSSASDPAGTTGDTALYDALGVYLDGAFAQDGRKVLLLYTDGADTRSRTTRDDIVDLVRASDVHDLRDRLPEAVAQEPAAD